MNKIKEYFRAYSYGIIIFFILIFFIISHFGRPIDQDVVPAYVIDYNTGFGGRKLLATIFNLLFGFRGMAAIKSFIFAVSVVICLLFASLCNSFIVAMKSRSTGHYLAALYLTALYLLCPASIMFLLKAPNYGRPDICLYASCLLFATLFYYRKWNRFVYFCVVSLIMIAAILTTHVFVATYMTFFITMFVYDIWSKVFDKKVFFCYFFLGLVVSAVVLFILLFSSMNLPLDEAIHYNPHLVLNRKMVCFGYYAGIANAINYYVLPKLPRLATGFLLSVLFLTPLFVALYKIWSDTFRFLNLKTDKYLLIAMQCSFLLFIPAFCIAVDYPRWFGSFIFIQFLLIAYFAFDQTSLFGCIGDILIANLRHYVVYATFLLIYCSILEYFYSDLYFKVIELIIDYLNIVKPETLLPPEYRL